MTLTLILISALLIKHFVADFYLQKPYHYLNKGTYGHAGGIAHAAHHVLLSLIVLIVILPMSACWWILLACAIEGVLHYHIDWSKVQVNKRYNLKPDNSEKYWWLLGLDQLLHQATYILMIAICI